MIISIMKKNNNFLKLSSPLMFLRKAKPDMHNISLDETDNLAELIGLRADK